MRNLLISGLIAVTGLLGMALQATASPIPTLNQTCGYALMMA